jgi:cytochrome c oxidase subunit 2
MSELSPNVIEQSERRWTYVVAGVIGLVFAVIIYSSLHWAAQPPSNVETIDASRLHLAGEFVEENLGTAVQPDGSVIVRVIAQQYSFVPSCIVVPATRLSFSSVTSPDVVHGFLIRTRM